MATIKIRKQIYLQERRAALLKHLSQTRGLSEAEIIRQAIEKEAAEMSSELIFKDRSAWKEFEAFLDVRQESAIGHQPNRWNRDEIYAERESRWLRDRDQE